MARKIDYISMLAEENAKDIVNKGAKGIALIDEDAPHPRLKYVFDVSDVHKARRIGRDPYLWQMREEHEEGILKRLEKIYAAIFHTGSEVLDYVLREKSLLFNEYHIAFSLLLFHVLCVLTVLMDVQKRLQFRNTFHCIMRIYRNQMKSLGDHKVNIMTNLLRLLEKQVIV